MKQATDEGVAPAPTHGFAVARLDAVVAIAVPWRPRAAAEVPNARFFGVLGKALAFLGPPVFGTVSSVTGSQRPAILSVGAFFVVGIVLLSFVDESKGIDAARIPVEADA